MTSLASVRSQLVADVGEALGGRTAVAFVNYPDISNVGDSALWLGSHDVLRNLDVRVVRVGSASDLDMDELLAREPEAILINGGGNFGDLWAGQQQAREAVVAARPPIRLVQLPQSVHFDDPENEARNIGLWAEVDDAVLMWRDEPSASWGRLTLPRARHMLSHDLAFGLSSMVQSEDADKEAVWLVRRDKEGIHRPLPPLPDGMWETY